MAKPITVYKEAGYLIRANQLTEDQIDTFNDAFTYAFYNESACNKCDQLENRHSEICDNCGSFNGFRRLSKIVTRVGKSGKENEFLSLPYGATKQVRALLKELELPYAAVDRHAAVTPFKRPIKFTGDLRPYQVEAKDAILSQLKGFIQSPPRSGKTVIATAAICEIGCKTLIIASQIDWLRQFRETFLGSATQEGFTTARPSQVRLCNSLEDFQEADVCLSTFSKFMSEKGKRLLSQISSYFNVVVVDEAHYTPALETSRVLSQFNSTYRIGLSGTVERKNTSEIQIAHDLLGPIIYRSVVERLRPKVHLVFSNVKIDLNGSGQRAFTGFVSRLEKHSKRVKLISKLAVDLVSKGHMILLPVTRVHSIKLYTDAINQLAEETLAYPFFGGLAKDKREKTIEMARQYKAKVLVGNIRLLSTGLNIPRASCIIDRVTVTSNIPTCDQRVSRILTPMEGKPQPLLVMILDDSDIMRSCLRNEWWQCIKPRHNPILASEDYKALAQYLSKKKTSHREIDLQEGL